MKSQTLGYFDFVGMIKGFGTESVGKDIPSKNNPNWIYNRMSIMLTDGNGKNVYLNIQDGYDKTKGKMIFVQSVNDAQMTISFADRFNNALRETIKDNSFFKVATDKTKIEAKSRETGEVIMENGEPKMIDVWNYHRSLTVYEMINFLPDKLSDGLKVRITGQVRYREYQGSTQREYNVQRVYFLQGDTDTPCEFKITQTVLVTPNSVDYSKVEEGVAKVNAKVYLKKNKDEMMIVPLPLTVKATTDNNANFKRSLQLVYEVPEDKVMRIKLNCYVNSGYVQAEISDDVIPPEMVELIELGMITKEEIAKSYNTREKVDELVVSKPALKDGSIDKDFDSYTLEDLENLKIEHEGQESNGGTDTQPSTPSTSEPSPSPFVEDDDDEFDLDKELGL